MVALGRANSRMKDFYDIWILTKTFNFAPDRLARAIAATFSVGKPPFPRIGQTRSHRILLKIL